MAIIRAEWWAGVAATPRSEISLPDKLKRAIELMAANVGRTIGRLANPPYPTPDGKPLTIRFYEPGEFPFPPEQMVQLAAIAKMFEDKPSLVAGPGLRSPIK